MTKNAVIVYAKRTAMGKLSGAFSETSAVTLGASLVKDACSHLGLKEKSFEVDEILMGQVLTAGCGQSPAKQAALGGGLSPSVKATTVSRVCGSGLKSVQLGYQSIALGESRVVFAGGQENMSLAPHLLPNSRSGYKFGSVTLLDHMAYDGLTNPYDGLPMGNFADMSAKEYKISREDQDNYAIRSYERSRKSTESGHFSNEIVPFTIKTRKGETLLAKDEEPFSAKLEKIPNLRPAFTKEGTVTAANASSINDGAALLVLMEEELAKDAGFEILGRVVAQDSYSGEPKWFTTAPVESIKRILEKTHLKISDIEQFEINEAFSVVPQLAIRELGLDTCRVNPYGGAVSLGHPIGASGARILVTLLNGMREAGSGKLGLASICIGGGEASSLLIETI